MINIAICDDDQKELQTLTCLFNKYKELKPTPIHLHSFENGFSLLDAIDRGERFDIAILDIIMPGENAGFIIYSGKQYTRVLFSQLVYAEAMHKSVILYLADYTTVSSVMTFTELINILEAHSDFIRPHRSYVVNMNFIRYIDKSDICLIDGNKIPLSRNNYTKVSKDFLDFVCSVSFGK
ncbi:MAG: DNA-binding response regulator [Blautia sp.]|nr:DNA-binding response regulator [Blautia sp.]